MKNYEEFLKLENSEKFNYFIAICEKAYGAKLKAQKRRYYLKELNLADYDYWASFRDDFDFRQEYEKMIKLNEIIIKNEEKTKKENEQKAILPAGVIVAKFEGYDADTGEKIKAGDWIVKVPGGWSRIDNAF